MNNTYQPLRESRTWEPIQPDAIDFSENNYRSTVAEADWAQLELILQSVYVRPTVATQRMVNLALSIMREVLPKAQRNISMHITIPIEPLAEKLGVSDRQVRRAKELLEIAGVITLFRKGIMDIRYAVYAINDSVAQLSGYDVEGADYHWIRAIESVQSPKTEAEKTAFNSLHGVHKKTRGACIIIPTDSLEIPIDAVESRDEQGETP